ncbi:hypothetical protein [Luteitalea pratensis]|nr:hypothetical protein [Luteitalea pratensis]
MECTIFSRFRRRSPSAFVALIAVAAFSAALPNGWLGDDTALLEERLASASFSTFSSYFSEGYWGDLHSGGLFRPLSLVLLGLQRIAFGLSPEFYRCVTLILHAACSVMVAAWLRRSVPQAAAVFGAVLFATHPVHAEAVATVYGQQDVWAALFFLAALLASPPVAARSARFRSIAAGLFLLLSLLCKEQGVLLPLLVFVERRLSEERGGEKHALTAGPAFWFAVALTIYALLRVHALGAALVPAGEASIAFGYPWWARVHLVVATVGTYVRLLIIPVGQTTYYGHLRSSILGLPVVEALVLAAALVGLLELRKRLDRQIVALASVILLVTLLPVANVIPIGMVVGERCLYLPVLSISLLAAAACVRFAPTRTAARAAVCALALAGIAASARVVHQWRSPLAHWEATVASHPTSPMAQARLALLLLQDGSGENEAGTREDRIDRAETASQRAILLNHRSPEAWGAACIVAVVRGDCERARTAGAQAEALGFRDVDLQPLLERCW